VHAQMERMLVVIHRFAYFLQALAKRGLIE
jgi:hypothetical protein